MSDALMQKRSRARKAAALAMLGGLALGGCAGGFAPGPTTDPHALAETGSGLLLLHTSLHDEGCGEVTAALGTPVMSGRVIDVGRMVTLRRDAAPSPALLPAGSYGIVSVACEMPDGKRVFAARVAERGSAIDGSGTVYEAPLASFRIAPGEILDGGSLRLAPTRPGRDPGPFVVAVAPSPEPWLRELGAIDPNLVAERVARPLSTARPRTTAEAGPAR